MILVNYGAIFLTAISHPFLTVISLFSWRHNLATQDGFVAEVSGCVSQLSSKYTFILSAECIIRIVTNPAMVDEY